VMTRERKYCHGPFSFEDSSSCSAVCIRERILSVSLVELSGERYCTLEIARVT
jgi:hypothetical protein